MKGHRAMADDKKPAEKKADDGHKPKKASAMLYDNDKSKAARGEKKPEPAKEGGGDGKKDGEGGEAKPKHTTLHEKHRAERDAMHKTHEAERRDLHGSHREAMRAMHERHEGAFNGLAERQLADLEMGQGAAAGAAPGAAPAGAPAAAPAPASPAPAAAAPAAG
jgi:hypothetical protein